jgi:L-ascorbate metabolism protein UlaG (beta-lactamase superfamily)
MRLKKLAQSTILLTNDQGSTLLIDPGKYNLDEGRLTYETFPLADAIVITHKHADHFDPELVKSILDRSKPHIITNQEIATILRADGRVATVLPIGDTIDVAGFALKAIRTDHTVRDELIVNFGVVVTSDNVSLYHASDTRFIDPALLPPETHARYLLVPISNRGMVMGVDDALVFAGDLKPHLAIPIHYDSPKDRDRVQPDDFISRAASFGFKARALSFGQEIVLD